MSILTFFAAVLFYNASQAQNNPLFFATNTPQTRHDLEQLNQKLLHPSNQIKHIFPKTKIQNTDQTAADTLLYYTAAMFESMGIYKQFKALGLEGECMKSPDLYLKTTSWLGVPYRWGGSTPQGIDCSRLVMEFYKTIYDLPIAATAKQMHQRSNKIEDDELQEGDLVFFKIRKKDISHVGIYLCNDKFLHASSSQGVTISSLSDPYFKKYYISSGRLKNPKKRG